jgi:hypothetical protein
MAPDSIFRPESGGLEEGIRRELDRSLGGDRQRRFRRFLMAALGSVPWVGGFIAAVAALSGERGQQEVNELQREWLEEHRGKLQDLARTLVDIVDRLESFGEEIRKRIESEEYLALVRRAFRVWDSADTDEKRRLVKNLLMNAGGTSLCPDDLVRLFIQWIDYYHEAHFAVIRTVFRDPGATRADIWADIHGREAREDSAEADLFKLLIRDLSTGGVIRQHRETTPDGQYLRKTPARRPRGFGAARTMKSAFDDSEQYELTELGGQFVHYTMNEVVSRLTSKPESDS